MYLPGRQGIPMTADSISDILELRAHLRRQILTERDSLSPEFRSAASLAITDRLWPLEPFAEANTLFTYVNFRSEPETGTIIHRALAAGKVVTVPYTVIGSHLLACRIKDPALELRPGYCSIPEPDPATSPPVAPRSIDVVLLPGSVFDLQGGRLGYGGGYYDRFLAREAPQALRIGLAFEKQVVDKLPLELHDIPLHLLVTEERLLDFRKTSCQKEHHK
ncbi:MAG: 5-formyltetrahydrofolate cyclo-ligase [Deltaproteobacteria bacterium]